MGRKIIFGILLLASSMFANKAQVIDIVNENILKIKSNDKIEKVHLAGIKLFANEKYNNQISYQTKDELRNETIAYIKKSLENTKEIKYGVIDVNKHNIKKVWIITKELNYNMVRDGYALVDKNDLLMPSMLKMRMKIAMKHAMKKKLGLWKTYNLASFIKKEKSQKIAGLDYTRDSILKDQISKLPKKARYYLNRKLLASK